MWSLFVSGVMYGSVASGNVFMSSTFHPLLKWIVFCWLTDKLSNCYKKEITEGFFCCGSSKSGSYLQDQESNVDSLRGWLLPYVHNQFGLTLFWSSNTHHLVKFVAFYDWHITSSASIGDSPHEFIWVSIWEGVSRSYISNGHIDLLFSCEIFPMVLLVSTGPDMIVKEKWGEQMVFIVIDGSRSWKGLFPEDHLPDHLVLLLHEC